MQGEKLGLDDMYMWHVFGPGNENGTETGETGNFCIIVQVLSFIVVLPFAKSAGARGSNNSRSSYRKQTESKMHSVPFARRVQRGVDNLQVLWEFCELCFDLSFDSEKI